MPGPLVTAEWLREHLDDEDLVLVEVDQEPDMARYLSGHVPGAHGWYWKDVVWDSFEREFPTPQQLARSLGELGVGDDATLVLYGERNQYAIYCYWVMTEMCGFERVHVLDGGKTVWEHRGYGFVDDVPQIVPTTRSVPTTERRDRSRIRRDELLDALRSTPPRLVDARYEEEYDGRRVKPGTGFDHGAERRGHIPGARNVPYESFFSSEDGRFLPPDELRAIFEQVDATPEQADEVVAYCRLGHRASLVWFVATQLLGFENLRVYDGSWTEWGSMVGVPVER